MTSAALYLRVSLDATGEQLAVSRQREDCRRIAAERGWAIVEEYVDNSVSASKAGVKRPAYDRMVADYAAGRFAALVCWDLDRLTRQPRQLEDWIDAAEQRGLLLTTANGEADLSTDGGRLFARIKASVARAEVERKSARQKAAAAQRAEHGRAPRGVRLTGYTVAGEIVPDEAEVVAQVFARFVAGDSLRGIAAWLPSVAPTRNGRVWNPSTVRTILVNPRYAGRAVYRGRTTGKRGDWEAIVDDATFDAAQEILSDPRRIANRKGTDRRYLGSSIYRCGVCAQTVRSHSGNRYRCPEGGHITRMAPSIDAFVRGVIRERLSRPDVSDLLTEPDNGEAVELAQEVAELRGRLVQVEADYDADLIDGRRYAVKTEKLRAQLAAAESARGRALGNAGLMSVMGASNPALAFDDAPLGVQRAILEVLVSVTLLPAKRGYKFDTSSISIAWGA
ncbi:recombinase family protein [Actinomycetospora sp. C-140]